MTALPAASPEDVGLSAAALARLSTALKDRVAAGHVPGAVALVARHGKIAYHEAFGAIAPGGPPMTTDAVMGDSRQTYLWLNFKPWRTSWHLSP